MHLIIVIIKIRVMFVGIIVMIMNVTINDKTNKSTNNLN